MTNKNNFKLAIPTDAIKYGYRNFIFSWFRLGNKFLRTKRLFNKRLPSFEKSDIEYIKNSVKKNNTKICSLSNGIF